MVRPTPLLPSSHHIPLSTDPLLTYRIGEKFVEWSDTTPSLDTILTNVSFYWFTQGFPTSIYPYRALFSPSRRPFDYIKKPTGYSFFPYELYPGLKSNVAKNVNLVHYAQHEHGGHFAALERPADLWGDVQGFVKEAWKEGDAKL
jgi:microsomal epoxide hydrolase